MSRLPNSGLSPHRTSVNVLNVSRYFACHPRRGVSPQHAWGDAGIQRASVDSTPQYRIDARENQLESAARNLAEAISEDLFVERGHQRDVRNRVLC
jgi:hypothetical protein